MPRKPPSPTAIPFTSLHLLLLLVMVRAGGALTNMGEYHPCKAPENTASHGQWDRIPTNFTVRTSCMRVLIDELCKNNFPDVSAEDIGPDKTFDRGIPNCQGANCSIECLHHTFCDKPLEEMEMPLESVPQQAVGYLPETINALPRCSRYLSGVNKTIIMEAGYSCWDNLQCICGMCCESIDKTEVIMRMLDQTYKDLQAHISTQQSRRSMRRPFRLGQGTLARPRVVGYSRPNRQ